MQAKVNEDAAMDRAFLEALVERLTPEVWHIGWSDFAIYEGEDNARLAELLHTGKFNLARALLRAIDALASGSPEKMRLAVPYCLDEERLGRKIATEFAEIARLNTLKSQRRVGGTERGKQQQMQAEAMWQPWIQRFRKLRGSGLSLQKARAQVGNEMAHAGSGVDDRTLRKWLRN